MGMAWDGELSTVQPLQNQCDCGSQELVIFIADIIVIGIAKHWLSDGVHTFYRWGCTMACCSPHFSYKAMSCDQLSRTSIGYSLAPRSMTFWQRYLDGPSAMLESVGTLAYQGVS